MRELRNRSLELFYAKQVIRDGSNAASTIIDRGLTYPPTFSR